MNASRPATKDHYVDISSTPKAAFVSDGFPRLFQNAVAGCVIGEQASKFKVPLRLIGRYRRYLWQPSVVRRLIDAFDQRFGSIGVAIAVKILSIKDYLVRKGSADSEIGIGLI